LVATTGRTIGMWVFNLCVVVPPSVSPPGWATATIRFAIAMAPAPIGLAAAPVTVT
jgi:hypothetical protein